MLFAYPTGVQGNVINAGTNELILPNYKQTWANIRKISDAPEGVKHLSFKSQEYQAGLRSCSGHASGCRGRRPCHQAAAALELLLGTAERYDRVSEAAQNPVRSPGLRRHGCVGRVAAASASMSS